MIEIKNLNYNIGDKKILKDINCYFKKEKIYGIIGPNGAGKSTLLKHIMGIITPPKGSIFYNEKDIRTYTFKEYARCISYVFQENPRELDFTVYEMLKMGRYAYTNLWGHTNQEDEKIIEETIIELKLEHLKNVSIRYLSGGEAQKVFIARALVQNTPCILLDEPTSMLDIDNSIELIKLINRIKEKCNLTIIMVLHDLNLAFRSCDEILILRQGKVIEFKPANQILQGNLLKEVYHNKIQYVQLDGKTYIVPNF